MKKHVRRGAGIAALAIGLAGMTASQAQVAGGSPTTIAAGTGADDPATLRANALIAQMTLDEKISLLTTHFPIFSAEARKAGAPISAGFNKGVPRLGIPALHESDASLGVANGNNTRKDDTATALPAGLATGATFSPELARAGGAMIGAEAKAKRYNMLLAGGVNLTRDPWAGRNFEYLGEDPLLAGRLGGAAVAGVQSNRIAATVKHFALNSQETGRAVMDARIDPAALRESDLLAFELAMEASRPASVMCAYNKVNGAYACENQVLLTDVLRRDWGFRGWVMSDWGAVHGTEAPALAGLDRESGMQLDQLLNGAIFFTARLKAAVDAGRVPTARIDEMVRHILVGMMDSGAFDTKLPATPQPIDTAAGAAIAQQVAEAGIVLLRNEGGILPLARTARRIVVIGGHADVGVLSGGGSSQVRSVGGAPVEIPLKSGEAALFAKITYHASSPLAAIRAMAPGAQVDFIDGSDPGAAAHAAAAADIAIVFATQWRTEAEDLTTLALPDGQDALIAAVASANRRTVVVLESGGAVAMPWLDKVPAVMAAWYPGQRGGEAIARILFGEVNPSGRLPLTFPASAAQSPRPVPPGLAELTAYEAAKAGGDRKAKIAPFAVTYVEGANVGYRWHELKKETPLFPFGFGLSYTSFRYSKLRVTGGDRPAASIEVSNRGKTNGADVPQVYARAGDSSGAKTWRLAGFLRVEVPAGQTRRVSIPLEPRTFAQWDEANRTWRLPAGPVEIAIGHDATTLAIKGTLPRVTLAKR